MFRPLANTISAREGIANENSGLLIVSRYLEEQKEKEEKKGSGQMETTGRGESLPSLVRITKATYDAQIAALWWKANPA